MYTIGVDVGGTYTDLVATDKTGRTVFAKSPSTPADQSIGVMAGLEELARRLGVTRTAMLAATDRLVHGTTVATNALLERKGARVALLTTEGHRDVVEMREGLKPDRYDLRTPPPEPLVPRERRFGVRERLKADGSAAVALDATALGDVIAEVKRSGANSVAVCFLHAYLNPAHELAAAEQLAKELPDVSVSRSSDVLPQIKEYERVSTTIVNAYVAPTVRRYLTNLERSLAEAGFAGSLFVVLSHGGMAPVEEASRLAAGTVLSGPAGGISGSAAGGHGAGDRKEPLPVGQFQPLRDDLARRLEDIVHRPQRTCAAVLCKREAGAVKQLGNVAGRIDPDQEKRDLLETRPLQGRDAVRDLLEAGAELTRQRLQIVAACLDRFREHGIRHDERGGGVGRKRTAGQQLGALGRELAGFDGGADLVFQFQIGKLLGQLKIEARGIERVLQQQLSAMKVQSPDRAQHDVRRQIADLEFVPLPKPLDKSGRPGRFVDEPLGGIVEAGKIVAARGEKSPDFRDGIVGVKVLLAR